MVPLGSRWPLTTRSARITFSSTERRSRSEYLPPLARGEKLGAWGLTEPASGSDASAMRTLAVQHDAGWTINGSKNFITHGISADTCVVMAITDREMRSRGISAFVIERGTTGLKTGRKENKLGVRASETASIILEDCHVSNSALLGERGRGFVNSMAVLDGGRISIAALAIGIAQGAFESAVRYSKERHQFGRPIAEFEGIQFKLADMATQIDAARLLTLRAASLKDQKRITTRESAMAKLYASEVAVRVCEEAIQIHGGYGYMKDYPAEKYWRDAKICTIGEGTSEVQRLVIAREVLEHGVHALACSAATCRRPHSETAMSPEATNSIAGGNATGMERETHFDPVRVASHMSSTLAGSEGLFCTFRWRCHRLLNETPSA